MDLAKETQEHGVRPKCTQPDDSHELAAELFDRALTDAKISTAEAAYLFGVSESLVRRMRSKDARERASFPQMLKLPPTFHWQLHRAMNRKFGFWRLAMADAVEALGGLAMVVER